MPGCNKAHIKLRRSGSRTLQALITVGWRLQIVAALAACSLVFQDINPAYATGLLNAASSLYAEITVAANEGMYSNVQLTGCRSASDPISVRAADSDCPPPVLTRVDPGASLRARSDHAPASSCWFGAHGLRIARHPAP